MVDPAPEFLFPSNVVDVKATMKYHDVNFFQ